MHGFSKLPRSIVTQGKLAEMGLPGGIWTLKALLGLAVLKGEFCALFDHTGDSEHFPAALTDLTERACLRRNHAHAGLQELIKLGIVERIPPQYFHGRARRGTAVYGFCGPVTPWMPIPYARLRDSSPLLDRMRTQTRTSLVALKLLLIFCALRNSSDHTACISYDKLVAGYGLPRTEIRAGLDLLIDSKMVHVFCNDIAQHSANSYLVLGLGDRVPRLAQELRPNFRI